MFGNLYLLLWNTEGNLSTVSSPCMMLKQNQRASDFALSNIEDPGNSLC